MKRSMIITAVLAVMVIGVVIFFAGEEEQPGMDKVNLRLQWMHQAQFAGYYIAEQRGFYEEQGIDVEISPGGIDFPAIQMVAGGSEHFGIAPADKIIIAREKGIPVVALAAIYRQSPIVFFALKESGIREPKDFVGKNVGVKPGMSIGLAYDVMMKNAGVDTSKVTEIIVKYDISPLLSGQVDVWPGLAINEQLTVREMGYEVNLIWPSDYGAKIHSDILFTTEDVIASNPELVERFVKATLKGWNYAYDNPDEAVTYTLMYSDQLSSEHETMMMDASLGLLKPDDKPIGYMDRNIWEDLQELLLENGFIENPVNIDEVYITRFLE